MTTQRTEYTRAEDRAAWRPRLLAIGVAIIVNLVILGVGRLATGDLPAATTGDTDRTVGFGEVITVTVLAGLAAWGLLALLERVTARASTIWVAIAVAVFALSLLGPLGGVDTESKLILGALHAGAAATIIPLMWRSSHHRS